MIVLVLGVVWFLVARVLKLASVGSLLCAVLFPVLVAVGGYGTEEVVVIAALAVIVIARHAANVRRLFQGRELRTGDGERGDPARSRPRRPRFNLGRAPVENFADPVNLSSLSEARIDA